MKSISNEFLHILKTRKLLVAIAAIIVVPILYAGMFLWAFWDPYDRLADLPIAVVNEDVGAYQDGEFYDIGNELVDNLKDSEELGFIFVDKETGEQGLEEEDYYILVKIPENFSENALTVMDEHPKKAELMYIPNESYNFLAAQIGETAMLKIEVELQEKLTETYAETIFDKITEVADGLADASDATVELHDGATELQDGSVTLQDGLQTLAEKSLEFTDGVDTAADGTDELANGATELADGLNQLEDASGQLLDASGDIKNGATDLQAGIQEANDGVQALKKNMPSLVAGTNDVQDGLTDFKAQLPGQMATQISEQINASATAINDGLTELEAGIKSGLTGPLTDGLTNGLAEQIIAEQTVTTEALMDTLLESGVDPQIVQAIANDLTENATTPEQLAAELRPQISGAIGQTVKEVDQGFTTYSNGVNEGLSNATGGIKQSIQTAVNPVFDQLIDGVKAINDGQIALQTGVTQLASGTSELKAGSAKLAAGQAEYVDSLGLFSGKMTDAVNGTDTLATGSSTLLDGMHKLQDASLKLNDGTEELADGSEELTDGMDTLVDGADEFKTEMKDAADEAADIKTDEDTYNMMASPVEVKNEKINEVPNYGTGFAPYFLSLGLFVGALLMSIVFPLREPASRPKNAFQWFYSKFGVILSIGVLQALLASGFLLIVLGLEVQSVPLFLLFAIITSLTFVTLIQFLVTCLADPGRFIAILILIIQLTTSAGTFPLELIPKALQPLNFLFPMTYSVSGLKAVISSGDYGVMWQNAGILIGFTIVCMLLTFSYFAVMYKRRFGKDNEDTIVSKA